MNDITVELTQSSTITDLVPDGDIVSVVTEGPAISVEVTPAKFIDVDVQALEIQCDIGEMMITITASSLDDLLTAIRGSIIRGGVESWEILNAKTARAVVIGDGADLISRALELADLPEIGFADLSDTPDDLSSYAGKYARVSEDGTAIEFNVVDTELPESPTFTGTVTIRGNLHLDGDLTNYSSQTSDIGTMQDSDKRGYGDDYITNKRLNNVFIGGNQYSYNGAIRMVNGVLQVYANDVWNDIVMNFRLREDSGGAYELEHQPIGFNAWYEVMSGNSDLLGLNGRPLVRQYRADMGAYPYSTIKIDGGSF